MAFPGKQYGLIISQKAASKTTTLPRPSVFGDDSDEETSVGESLQKEARKKRMMKQTHLEMQKALEQDSSVYDYDGVYEDMQKQRLESSKKILGGTDRKPKYINQLMRAVEERKKEQERRDERKIQKERVAEGEQFADKEAYVTSAYRQKLKERQEEEEREKREAAIEAALDVKKQKDMSGFYRHLLNQTVGEEAVPDRSVPRSEDQVLKTVKIEAPSLPPPSPPSRDHAPSSHSDSEEGRDLQTGFSKPAPGAKRQYRQRSPSSGSGDEKVEKKDNKSHKNRERDRERDRGRERDHERDRERDRERDHDRDREGRRGGRRDEKDRRRERDEDRGRRDKERGERMGKREGSPKVREERDGEKEKKRAIDDKGTEREKERSGEKEKTTMRPDRRDEEKKDKEVEKEKRQEEKEKVEHWIYWIYRTMGGDASKDRADQAERKLRNARDEVERIAREKTALETAQKLDQQQRQEQERQRQQVIQHNRAQEKAEKTRIHQEKNNASSPETVG